MIYTVKITGHYPVGACAVIVAPSRNKAKLLLADRLMAEGLLEKNSELTHDDFVPVNTNEPGVKFFMNGDY